MTVTIFAGAGWYRERPEPEQEYEGVLQPRPTIAGPASRAALSYTLVTTGAELPVYAAGVDRQLSAYIGRPVTVRGKLVDLSEEGFGPELWMGEIELQK